MRSAVGLAETYSDEPLRIERVAGLVTAALRARLGRRSSELSAMSTPEPGRMTLIFAERREGYVEEKLADLARLTQRSRAVGATHIVWG